MYGRLQEEVTWTRLLDTQREAENRRLGRELGRPAALPPTRWFAALLTRTARLALGRARDAAGVIREERDAVRDVA